MPTQHYIGIMSGTSMDGADAVLIAMQGTQWQRAIAHSFVPYPASLKTELLALQNIGENELHRSQTPRPTAQPHLRPNRPPTACPQPNAA